MDARRISTTCDLSEMALEQVAHEIGPINLCDITLYCGQYNRFVARKLQGRFGFALVIVPDIMLKKECWWLADHPRGAIYSEGV